MKSFYSILIGFFITCSSFASYGEDYTLVWADEFNEGTLNHANWNIEVNGDGNGNSELQYYTDRPENVSIGTEPVSGKKCLVLTARKENYFGRTCTSGRITTQNKVYFTHGKIEASIKFPRTANGLWPAFWMMGNDYQEVGWPRCGEIDIVEMGNANGIKNNTQDRYFNGACHWGFYKNGAYPNYANHQTSGYDLQDDFHLFTVYWDENSIRMYVDQDRYPDAQPYFEMGLTDKSDEWSTGNYFHKPNFILFNLAAGGHFTGIYDINDVTPLSSGEASMYVDYVRVYQRGTADETFHQNATSGTVATNVASTTVVCPNPAEDYIVFNRTVDRVEVVNSRGNITTIATHVNAMDVSFWERGMYILRIKTDENEENIKLLVR